MTDIIDNNIFQDSSKLTQSEKVGEIIGAQWLAQFPDATELEKYRSKLITDQIADGVHIDHIKIPVPLEQLQLPGAIPELPAGAMPELPADAMPELPDAMPELPDAMPAMDDTPLPTEAKKDSPFIPNPHFTQPKAQHTDEKRGIRLMTPLGKDALIIRSATLREPISSPFLYDLHVYSEQFKHLTPSDLIGSHANLAIIQEDNSMLYRNGVITQLETITGRSHDDEVDYRIVIEPWTQLLSEAKNYRIYQKKTVQEVILELFSDIEGASIRIENLTGHHRAYEYWVQYGESRMDYFHRICEREGLGYYFSHEDTDHFLTIFDNANLLPIKTSSSGGPLIINPQTHEYSHFVEVKQRSQFVVGETTQSTYNYETPSKKIISNVKVGGEIGEILSVQGIENYRFAEEQDNSTDGQAHTQRVNLRQGANKSLRWVANGNYRNLYAGDRFTLARAPNFDTLLDEGQLYTVVNQTFFLDEEESIYRTQLELVGPEVVITPIAPPRPRARSNESARVTGPEGSEIYTDALGRIKVQFHWDRYGENNENTTCWLRVMNNFSGSSFGVHFTPRIGQEVLIGFENGNPDKPFVMGALYHAEHSPPFANDSGLRTGFRTRSTQKGEANNYNELSFYDHKNGEQVYLQAERDMSVRVKNNRSTGVGHCEQKNVGKTLTVEAGKQIELKVGSSRIVMDPDHILVESVSVTVKGAPTKIN